MRQFQNQIHLCLVILIAFCSCKSEDPIAPAQEPTGNITIVSPGTYSTLDSIYLQLKAKGVSQLAIRKFKVTGNTLAITPLGNVPVNAENASYSTTWQALENASGFDVLGEANVPFSVRQTISKVQAIAPNDGGSAPATVKNDSVFTINFSVKTVRSNITKVELFRKLGTKDFETSPLFSQIGINSKTYFKKGLSITMPSAAQVAPGENLSLKLIATSSAWFTEEFIYVVKASMP